MVKDKYDYAIKNNLVKATKDGSIYKKYSDGSFRKAPQSTTSSGYKAISVTIDGKQYGLCSHRIIAKLFIPNPENKQVVNHIDRNKSNNNIDNLEWCTQKENTHHALGKCVYCKTKTRANYKVCAPCRRARAKAERRRKYEEINRIK